MNKVCKGLIVLVIILSLLVVGLGGYIVYDKVFENALNVDNNELLLTEYEAKDIVKQLDEKYYSFYTTLGPYCGEYNRDDYISFGSYETGDFRDYWRSAQFTSISELKGYLELIMIDDLVPKYINDGVSYIEQDGKLYCQLAHKGGGITRNYDVDAEYNIRSITIDKIVSDVVFCGSEMGEDECSDKNLSITIVKDVNDNWLVSEYKLIYG